MSKNGAGRGRGWMNLPKNQQNASQNWGSAGARDFPSPPHLKDEHEFKDVDEYKDLIKTVKELSLFDDGIKFNQKIKYILENWKQDCQTSEEVEKSFNILYQGSLNDEELASKLVIMISSRSFISQEVHGQNLRSIFLRRLQSDFEDCKILHRNNPTAFRNSVKILGEFYNKARLINGQPFTFMLGPLIIYLDMLLESANVLELQLFASQLYINGTHIKTEFPTKLNDLVNKVRVLLTSDKNISSEGKLWLLLSLELVGNKFLTLPIEVFKFYQEKIGNNAMTIFQTSQNILSVQTVEDNKTLENYQSNVNVLQLSTKSDVVEQITSLSNNCDTHTSFSSTSGFVSDTSSQNSSIKDSGQNSGKFGRPILGAGARLNKNKSNEVPADNRKERKDSNSLGWVKSSGPGWKDRGPEKNSKNKSKGWDFENKTKGWEHDDRLDNEYS